MSISDFYYFVLSKIFGKHVYWKGVAAANGLDAKDRKNLYRCFFANNNNSSGNGRKPSKEVFCPEGYLLEYPEIASSNIDPWMHYVEHGNAEGRDNGLHPSEELFFKEGYLAQYPDIENCGIDPWMHYVEHGKNEGRDNGWHPSEASFFKEGYLAEYPDIENSGVDPWIHYAKFGKAEGRDNGLHPSVEIFDSYKYFLMFLSSGILPSVSWKDYVLTYSKQYRYDPKILIIKNSTLFDEDWYKWNNADIDFSKITPAEHYLYEGWKQGRNPSPDFSTALYLEHYPDLQSSGICPLYHYESSGRLEGRSHWSDINARRNNVAKALKKNKSVLLISHEFSHTGAPISLLFAAKILKSQGYSVAAVSLSDGKLSSEFESLGVPCCVTGSKAAIELLASVSDTVIVNTLVCYEYYELCARVSPTIWWIRETPELLNRLGYCAQVLKSADNVYVMSDYSRSQFGQYNNKIKVIRHGLTDTYQKEHELLQDEGSSMMFTFLGSYNRRKGLDVLLLAIGRLPDAVMDNCYFFFAGNMHEDEGYVAELCGLVKGKHKDHIIFHDSITDKAELEQVFYKSACFIVPSREEPTSRVAIEAMMHGRPCIMSDRVGAKYLVNSSTGLIFANESAEELSSCIQMIYDKLKKDRHCYFNSARQAYLNNNSVENYTKNLIESISAATEIFQKKS